MCVASAFPIATGKHIGDCDACAFDLSFVRARQRWMHHLAVVAVVPGSELAGGLMDVVLRELWK